MYGSKGLKNVKKTDVTIVAKSKHLFLSTEPLPLFTVNSGGSE